MQRKMESQRMEGYVSEEKGPFFERHANTSEAKSWAEWCGGSKDTQERRRLVSHHLFRFLFAFGLVLFGLRNYYQPPISTRLKATNLPSRSVDAAPKVPLLQDFQVYPPVLTPSDHGNILTVGSSTANPAAQAGSSSGCVVKQTLMKHIFANSYGHPFVGPYTPPGCNFNRVTLNFTVVSAGIQFDRLALMYLGDTEVFRTSTAEPTKTGIEWTYLKDMSNYLALFKQPQKIIFDLGNLINSNYTASFNATLTATFFTSEDTVTPADQIIPVSARQSNNDSMPSAWQVPAQNASNTLTLPRNIDRAVFSISACGQIDEEFWYGNVPTPDVNTFPNSSAELFPYSPFREVQLFIDGELAGVAWPFPIIFTGGVVPGFWRPIVGIDAFDLRQDEIDITPWLPLLCDGGSHTYEIRVAGINYSGKGLTETVGSYWVVTGTIFLWLGPSGFVTSGSQLVRSAPEPSISISSATTKGPKGLNKTLSFDVAVSRQLSISSTVKTSQGEQKMMWQQDIIYSNAGFLDHGGNFQAIVQNTTGVDSARDYSKKYNYPIAVNTTFKLTGGGGFTLDGILTRGEDIQIMGQPVFPTGQQSFEALPRIKNSYPSFQGTHLSTVQNGTAAYAAPAGASSSTSFGSTEQDMVFSGLIEQSPTSTTGKPHEKGSTELYHRHVLAVNTTVVDDQQSLAGEPLNSSAQPAITSGANDAASENFVYADAGILRTFGRGPPSS